MKELVKRIIGIILVVGIVLGIAKVVGLSVEWLCADKGRYILAIGILSYIAYRFFKIEFGE